MSDNRKIVNWAAHNHNFISHSNHRYDNQISIVSAHMSAPLASQILHAVYPQHKLRTQPEYPLRLCMCPRFKQCKPFILIAERFQYMLLAAKVIEYNAFQNPIAQKKLPNYWYPWIGGI